MGDGEIPVLLNEVARPWAELILLIAAIGHQGSGNERYAPWTDNVLRKPSITGSLRQGWSIIFRNRFLRWWSVGGSTPMCC